jgi:hypothetical protein
MKNTEVSENDLERLNLSIDDLNEVKVQIPESLEKAQVFLKECA